MGQEFKRRPRRIPLTPEEVAAIIAFKKRKEWDTLQKLKKSRAYKILNIINIICIFVYLELLICFFGPTTNQRHYIFATVPHYGDRAIISDIDVTCADGMQYNFVIDDFIKLPYKGEEFFISKDFLLHKDLKGRFEYINKDFRLFSASPVLFLCMFVLIISLIAFNYNLNENSYSLIAVTVLNILTLSGITML